MSGYCLVYPQMLLLSSWTPVFYIYTDHRPLQGVFQKDIFDLASPRLQRLQEKIAMYSFRVCWVSGKTHLIADALSRAPLFARKNFPALK